MSAEDLTDGGGWAKLDNTGARRLADIVAGFSPRTVASKTRMLLSLYASTNRLGKTSVGKKRLSELADVSEDQASRFLKELKDDGILLTVDVIVSTTGRYEVRQFSWIEGAPQKSAAPGVSFPEKSAAPGGRKPGKSAAHTREHRSRKGTGAPASPGPGPEEQNEPKVNKLENWTILPPCAVNKGGGANG